MSREDFGVILLGILCSAILFVPVVGYVKNLYLTTQLDFDSPYKAEVFRVTGMIVPPLGCIIGFIDIEDEKDK